MHDLEQRPSSESKSSESGGILQRKGGEDGAKGASSQQIAASGFSGPAMSLPYQSQMEASFGVSFSGVQAYGGGAAAAANSQLGSQAYAVGQQIAFADASPSPVVVAHELAHTIQQGSAGPVQTWSEGENGDAFEAEADHAAAAVMMGEKPSVSMRTGATISKWGGSDHYTIGNTAAQKALQQFRGLFPGQDPGVPVMHGTPMRADGQGHLGGGVMAAGPNGTIAPAASQDTLGMGTNTGQMTFGAASRMGGDYDPTVGQLANRRGDLGNTITQGASGGAAGGNWVGDKINFAQMAMGGTTNSNHFFPVNGAEYRHHHAQAVALAGQAYQAKQQGNDAQSHALMQQAMQEEGFGNHFLQDTFSSGHMAPRSLDSTEHLVGEGPGVIARTMNNVANGITQVVATPTQAVGSMIGGVGGAAGGFFGSLYQGVTGGGWSNPFRRAAQGASEGWQAGGQVGHAVGAAVGHVATAPLSAPAAMQEAPGFMHDAAQGLARTKQWHDYFCALPNGLPTSRGNFHGDYYMDGNDLEIVSTTCANSILEVLSAGQGAPASFDVQIPVPNFSAIMADPQAGPVWRMMMMDYKASLEAARAAVRENPNAQHTTDGGTTVASSEIVDQIYANVFGGDAGMAQAEAQTGPGASAAGVVAATSAAVTAPVQTLQQTIQQVQHYASGHFGFNAALGPAGANGQPSGLDDELNAPASRDPDEVGFDPVQVEQTYGLYSNLSRVAREFAAAAAVAMPHIANADALRADAEIAQQIATTADGWAQTAHGLASATDVIKYGMGHGSISSHHEERVALRADVRTHLTAWAAVGTTQFTATEAAPGQGQQHAG
jgi:hypothetical protein